MIEGVSILLDGVHHTLPNPNRHHHVIRMLADKGFPVPIVGTQGFYSENGEFLCRIAAAAHAIGCGQIEKLKWGKKLYSEDLW